MDFSDPAVSRVFFELHSALPREGPGSRECTARALTLADALPGRPRLLDIGCGPGMQTLDLAELLPQARITAVDNHAPYLAELQRRAAERGVARRVTTVLADMRALPFAAASFDLLWCEGAAYIMGVGNALKAWRPLLAPGGRLALTEAVWLRPDPPAALRRWWDAGYADMRDVAGCRQLVADCGYRLLGDFVLPEAAWWDDYYRPMEARLARLTPAYSGDDTAQTVLQDARDEIEMYRTYAPYYGYVFLVMAPA